LLNNDTAMMYSLYYLLPWQNQMTKK